MPVAVDPRGDSAASEKSSRRGRKRAKRAAKDEHSGSIRLAIELLAYRPVKSILQKGRKSRRRQRKKVVCFNLENIEYHTYPREPKWSCPWSEQDSESDECGEDGEEPDYETPKKREKSKKRREKTKSSQKKRRNEELESFPSRSIYKMFPRSE